VKSPGNVIRLAGIAGLAGPLLFAAVTILLTCAQYSFMRSLGWDPLMTATFLLSGAAVLFAIGLYYAFPKKIGPVLLGLAGLATMGLAFSTDPTHRATPATWHGRMHDLSFAALGLTLIPAMIFLGRTFRGDPKWRDLATSTRAAALLSIPAFAFKGPVFYAWLLAVLAWFEVVAWRLKTASGE
jgi:hypothetical protein